LENNREVKEIKTRSRKKEMEKEQYEPSLQTLIKNVYNQLTNLRIKKRKISKLFMTLPERDKFLDYYDHIKDPISFDLVCKKVNNVEYDNFDDFIYDCEMICKKCSRL